MNSENVGAKFHRPVMVSEVKEWLAVRPGQVVADVTLGGGGHALSLLEAISPGGELIGIDRDPDAIAEATRHLGRPGTRVRLIRGRMGDIENILRGIGVNSVDAIFADLGVSSFQLDSQTRGFSFMRDAPLDMRMDKTCGETAAHLLLRLSEGEIGRILKVYGEERYAGRIAHEIARCRNLEITGQLVSAVMRAIPAHARHTRINPATRTFMALRIAVNDEMGELDRFLNAAPTLLISGGRLAVISYHSLEDRQVKRCFKSAAASLRFKLPLKRPLIPQGEEIRENPRARSAKLRVLERVE